MPEQNLGRVVPVHKGEWSAVASYVKLDIVTYNGSSYFCIVDSTNQLPTLTQYWKLLASKGDEGPVGDVSSLATKELDNLAVSGSAALDALGCRATIADTADINTFTITGSYRLTNLPVNAPAGCDDGILQVNYGGGDTISQVCFDKLGVNLYWRTGDPTDVGGTGSWTNWLPLYDNSIGAVATFAMENPPTGWLRANGALISRTNYANLFSAIGTVFGIGDGSTTFQLPDVRGEFIRCWDNGRGVDSGRTFGSFQADDFESHSHSMFGGFDGQTLGSFNLTYPIAGNYTSGSPDNTYWTEGGTETRPRNLALLACIKY